MQNEPNLKNTKINLTPFKTGNYEKNRPFTHRKNEPNTNPILLLLCCCGLQFGTVSTYSSLNLRATSTERRAPSGGFKIIHILCASMSWRLINRG